jgi:hypothetical protein
MRIAYKILVGKPKGERRRGRPKHRWSGSWGNGMKVVDWMRLAQDKDQKRAVVKMAKSLRVS